jgi:hypothetical protein
MTLKFPSHPDDVREAAAPHIYYELLAMVQARDLNNHAKKYKGNTTYPGADVVMQNCAIESFLLHYRALREFFNDKEKHKADDIKAKDYLPTWTASDTWLTYQNEIDRINKRLAHVSVLRKTLDHDWDLAHMEWNVSRTFEDFISKLTAVHQVWFADVTTLLGLRRPASAAILGADSNSTASGGTPMMIFPPFP